MQWLFRGGVAEIVVTAFLWPSCFRGRKEREEGREGGRKGGRKGGREGGERGIFLHGKYKQSSQTNFINFRSNRSNHQSENTEATPTFV